MENNFWSKMAYDIRTPMNTILGLTELGLREDMSGTVRNYTLSIQKAGKRLMSNFNAFTDFIMLENNELETVMEEYSLSTLIAEVVREIKEEKIKAEFCVFVDARLPDTLIGDAARLKQVLEILLSNAVKFTDRGCITLSVEGTVKKGVANLLFKVEDTGRGIKSKHLENIFKEFARFDSRAIEGTGLGLAIAKGLAGLMGGVISARSKYGKGSTFTVSLPQRVHGYGSPLCEIIDIENKYVLILEQKKYCTESIVRTLNNMGVANDVAINTSDFYDALSEGQFSHVFAAEELYNEFGRTYPNFPSAAKVIRFSENEALHAGGPVLTKPLYCVPVAALLNGELPEYRNDMAVAPGEKRPGFTAPEARVLIVDDISANLTIAQGFLEPYKMQVDTCGSGADAIEAVKFARYDLIFMDHLMPVMTGAEAAIYIRGMNLDCKTDIRNVPIIALTANTENASKRIFRRSGINDFLAKPIDADMLDIILEKWIPAKKQKHLSIPGINLQKGIAKTGGKPDMYIRVLKDFYENGISLTRELLNCAETGNLRTYQIHIHALNSISKTIGADELATLAAELETASERGDINYVFKNNPIFLAKLKTLLTNIREATDTETLPPPAPLAAKKKILIIDDNSSYLLILSDILKKDYETFTALDANDGIETARREMPDLILLDLVMPKMSGYEVLEILKSDEKIKHIPVILISGKGEESEKKGREMGAADYIRKPFDPGDVAGKVKSMLG